MTPQERQAKLEQLRQINEQINAIKSQNISPQQTEPQDREAKIERLRQINEQLAAIKPQETEKQPGKDLSNDMFLPARLSVANDIKKAIDFALPQPVKKAIDYVLPKPAKILARTVIPNAVLAAPEIAMAGVNLGRKLAGGEPIKTPVQWAQENLFPESWAPSQEKGAQGFLERGLDTVSTYASPTLGVKPVAQQIGKAGETVAKHLPMDSIKKAADWALNQSPWIVNAPSRLARFVGRGAAAVGRGYVDNSAKSLAKAGLFGAGVHALDEGGLGPYAAPTALALNIGASKIKRTGQDLLRSSALKARPVQEAIIANEQKKILGENPSVTERSFGNDVQKSVNDYFEKHPEFKEKILTQPDIDKNDYKKLFQEVFEDTGTKFFKDIDTDTKTFGTAVQEAVNAYRQKNQKYFSEKYNKEVLPEIHKTEPIDSSKVLNEYSDFFQRQINPNSVDEFLKGTKGKQLLSLLNMPARTNYAKLKQSIFSKIVQDNFANFDSLKKSKKSIEKILNKSHFSDFLLPKDKEAFVQSLEHNKKKLNSRDLKVQEEANSWFTHFLNNQSTLSTLHRPENIREAAIRQASHGEHNLIPTSEKREHNAQSYLLKEQFLKPSLAKSNPEALKRLNQTDKENKFWQERKATVNKISTKNMTPEQTTEALFSDVFKGAHNLKFVKGSSGKKARELSEQFVKLAGTEGESFDFKKFVNFLDKMNKHEKRIVMTGLTDETKSKIFKINKWKEGLSKSSNENLDTSLQELSPTLYEKHLKQQDAIKNPLPPFVENPHQIKRREKINELASQKLTPEETTRRTLSDIDKGAYNLKFVKGVAGDKARQISEDLVPLLSLKGQEYDVRQLWRNYKKLSPESSKIFWAGLSDKTKHQLKKTFNIFEELVLKSKSTPESAFNPIEDIKRIGGFGIYNRLKKSGMKYLGAKKYIKNPDLLIPALMGEKTGANTAARILEKNAKALIRKPNHKRPWEQ